MLDIPIYYADDRAKWLMENDPSLMEALRTTFGAEIYSTEGKLQRAYLADIVFNDQAQLAQLNGLVHPAVREDGIRWDQEHQNTPYTLREAALLYESGIYKLLDKIIAVTAPEALRIERVHQRDGLSTEQIKARMDQQWPEAKKVELADFVIDNGGERSLIRQVYQSHHQIISANK
jgi:dephospho-CoA kinase